jgi:hypothetical protein
MRNTRNTEGNPLDPALPSQPEPLPAVTRVPLVWFGEVWVEADPETGEPIWMPLEDTQKAVQPNSEGSRYGSSQNEDTATGGQI